jgi:hypothetical protein
VRNKPRRFRSCQTDPRERDWDRMHLNATLDLDVVAIEAQDEISVLDGEALGGRPAPQEPAEGR